MKLKGKYPNKLSQVGWVILGCVLFPLSSFGALFPVEQTSSPAGLVSQSDIIEQGNSYQSIDPQLTKNGYTFGYWAIDGVRQAGADGRALTRVSSVINTNSTYTAHYFDDDEDSDGDGVKDWFEFRMFGDLSKSPSDDSDGDGFSNKRESELGQDALIVDFMEPGGIAGRMSNTITYADTSMLKVTIKSNPTGFITTSITNEEMNASVSTQSLNGATNGSHFAYWTINGVRQASPNGVASSKVSLNISGDTQIVAHYIPSNEDSDGDGVMDWFELYQFGNLASGPEDDSDGDGFSNKREGELGQEATIAEFTEPGGIAGRMSNSFNYADTSMVLVTITSNPKGFITESVTYDDYNATVTTQNLNGSTNGSNFAYWTINGVRQFGPTGVSQSQVSAVITANTVFTAHYIPSTEDTDSDGVMDWFEMYQFGSLSLGPSDDPDGDGFSNKREGELGQEATIGEFTEAGGIAGRMSNSIVYYNQDYIDAKISGTVAYDGIVQGPAIVWALDENDTVVAQQILPNGYGSFEIQVPKLTSYDFKVFIDGLGNGNPSAAAPWKHYLDWNASAGGFNRLYVDRDLSGIDFVLSDKDSDFDGFLNWHEHIAGTNQNDANSTPGLDFGLIAHWTFDEIHGTVLGDSSGNDVNGTLHGFQNGWTAGRVGGALRFDGMDDHVSFPGQTLLDDIRPFSFSGWIKLDDNGSGYVLAKRSSSTGYWRFSVNNNMTWLVRKGTLSTPSVTYNYRPPDFSWQHIALSWSGRFGHSNLRIYHNGQLVSDATKVGGGGDRVSDANNLFTLGNRPQGNSSYFKGWMDDFRIWERVITAGEVDGMYTASPESNATVSGMVTHQGTVPGPVIVWAFDENGTKVQEQILPNGPSAYSFNLPAGHAYDLKAFRDGNGNGSLDPSIGEPYAHWGSWNGDGFDLFPVLGDSNDTDIAITWEVDADSDGYTLWEEHVGGSDDNNASSFPKAPPEGLQAVSSLTLLENQPVGTIIGEFNATDPDADAILTYTLVGGANDNHLFTLDTNGTLRSAFVYDYENNQSFSIRVKVRDQHNLWIKEDFIVLIGNELEDLDQDGVEDAYDSDDDGDGFSDAEEIAYGSDPRDSNSIANTAPQITLASNYPDNLDEDGVFHIGHPENLTEIIQVTATDVDGDDLNYSIYGWQDLHHFEINANTGNLSFKNAPDYEAPGGHNGNGVYGVVLRVSDGYSHDDQPLWVWVNDVNEAPYNLHTPAPLQVFENQPAGTRVGDFYATDQDANSTLLFSLSDENSSGQAQPFILDANGSLYTGRVFDYETDDQNYSLTVRVMDEYQLSLEKTFVISLIGEGEYIDDNGSGIDDDKNASTDNPSGEDNSTIENPPEASDFDLNGSTIAENQPAGSIVGQLQVLPGSGTGEYHLDVTGSASTGDNPSYESNEMERGASPVNGISSLTFNRQNWTPLSNVSLKMEDVSGGTQAFEWPKQAFSFDQRYAIDIARDDPTKAKLNDNLQGVPLNLFEDWGVINGDKLELNENWTLSDLVVDGNRVEAFTLIYKKKKNNLSIDNFSFDLISSESSRDNPSYEPNEMENGASPVNGISSLTFNRQNWFFLEPVSLKMEGVSGGTQAFEWPKHAISLDQRYSLNIGLYDPTKAKLNDNQQGVPLNLFEDWGVINGDKLELNENWTLSDLVVDGNRIEAFTLNFIPKKEKVSSPSMEPLFRVDQAGLVRTTRVLDFEMDGPLHSISVRMSGEGNTSVEKDFQIQLLDQFKPIVRTVEADQVTQDSARLQAKIVESFGMAEIIDWGLILSHHPDPSLEDNNSLIFLAESNRSTSFEQSVQGLAPDTDYFFRSFAGNAEGLAYGTVRKFKTLTPALSPVWSDALPVIDAPGWWDSPWFGTFFMNDDNGWVLHQGLGWIFILPQEDGIWMWHERLGWLWTSQEIYPFLFRNSTQDWVFFHMGKGSQSLVYDFGSRAWTIIP